MLSRTDCLGVTVGAGNQGSGAGVDFRARTGFLAGASARGFVVDPWVLWGTAADFFREVVGDVSLEAFKERTSLARMEIMDSR